MREIRTITMEEIQEKECGTFMKKDNSVRGCSCVCKSELMLGDEVVIDNYFTEIVK
jgi:hypothetical protein